MSLTQACSLFLLEEAVLEVWKDIDGYEELYQVSNTGKVRSLRYKNRDEVRELFLKPHNQGYLQVELHKNGKRKMFTVHRLVAMAFVDGYGEGKVVNHIDENKQNNVSTNLEWVSASQNVLHSISHRRSVKTRNYPKFHARTDKQEVIQISLDGKVIKHWKSSIEVKEKLGYSDWSIKQCCRRKRKTAYGYRWQYAV
ncbi:MAG: NUMOD4 domain-containing protein [Acutalibacteraceae bacterium]